MKSSSVIFSVTTYNRNKIAIPSLLQLISIIDGRHPILIQDDGSTDYNMNRFLKKLEAPGGYQLIHVNRNEHAGVDRNNVMRLDFIPKIDGEEFVYLTDDDMHYSVFFYTELLKMKEMMEDNPDVLAGTLFNVDGNKIGRHRMYQPETHLIYNGTNYYRKESFGGCSMLLRVDDFLNAMNAYRSRDYTGQYGWDWSICDYAEKHGKLLITTEKSYVQHIGTVGVNSRPHAYDSADNFIQ